MRLVFSYKPTPSMRKKRRYLARQIKQPAADALEHQAELSRFLLADWPENPFLILLSFDLLF